MNIKIRKPLCFSEIGRKDNQEDFLWPASELATQENRVFLMCDGVGGQDSGEVASETAATALGTYLSKYNPEYVVVTKAMFEEALAYGYDELDKVDTGAARKMGTTMTCLVLHQGGALVAHIGDSRIYHIRPSLADENGLSGIIYQSADHSLVNDLLRAGEITEEEAVNFPQKNVITRAMQPHLERRYRADIFNIDDLQAGDYFFLCSDGVLELLTNDMLGAILSDTSLDDTGKLQAIKSMCDNKTRDNYTCWLIPVDAVEGVSTGVQEDEVSTVDVEVVERCTPTPAKPDAPVPPVVVEKKMTPLQNVVKATIARWKAMISVLAVICLVVSGVVLFNKETDDKVMGGYEEIEQDLLGIKSASTDSVVPDKKDSVNKK